MTTLMNSLKKSESSSDNSFGLTSTSSRITKLTKPVKVPFWTKDMSLETYGKQISTWTDINEDVPEYAKYHDLIEELKKNKEIKGLQKYVTEHILPVLVRKSDQTLEKVIGLLDKKYGRSCTEKVEEIYADV